MFPSHPIFHARYYHTNYTILCNIEWHPRKAISIASLMVFKPNGGLCEACFPYSCADQDCMLSIGNMPIGLTATEKQGLGLFDCT